MRPLIYWADKAAGIAFAFSLSRHEKSWALDHTVVFQPGAECALNPEHSVHRTRSNYLHFHSIMSSNDSESIS